MLEDFLFSTVSTSVPEETKTNYATLMLLNPDFVFSVNTRKRLCMHTCTVFILPPLFSPLIEVHVSNWRSRLTVALFPCLDDCICRPQ